MGINKDNVVLVESDPTKDECIDCVFYREETCYEPIELNCVDMSPDKNKKYHWELEEIKPEKL